jgi:hypothetical protein
MKYNSTDTRFQASLHPAGGSEKAFQNMNIIAQYSNSKY